MIKGTFAPVRKNHIGRTNLWLPVIRVSLSDSVDPNIQNIIDDSVLAIVDTGSTNCCIDTGYIATHSTFRAIGVPQQVTGATGTIMSGIYSVQIIVDGHVLQMECPSIPLHSDDNPCHLLFGMDAIRFFDLSLHRYPQMITLTWIQQ
jgi:hypothetical protein